MATSRSEDRSSEQSMDRAPVHNSFMTDIDDLLRAFQDSKDAEAFASIFINMKYDPLQPFMDLCHRNFQRGARAFFPLQPFVQALLLSVLDTESLYPPLWMRLLCGLGCLVLVAFMFGLATQSIFHLEEDLQKEKIAPTRIYNIVEANSTVLGCLFLWSLFQLGFSTLYSGSFGFYFSLNVTLAMLTCTMCASHVQAFFTIHGEREIQKAAKAEKKQRLDAKDRKIASLETTAEGLHLQLDVLRQTAEEEKQGALNTQQAAWQRERDDLIQRYNASISSFHQLSGQRISGIIGDYEHALAIKDREHVDAVAALKQSHEDALEVRAEQNFGAFLGQATHFRDIIAKNKVAAEERLKAALATRQNEHDMFMTEVFEAHKAKLASCEGHYQNTVAAHAKELAQKNEALTSKDRQLAEEHAKRQLTHDLWALAVDERDAARAAVRAAAVADEVPLVDEGEQVGYDAGDEDEGQQSSDEEGYGSSDDEAEVEVYDDDVPPLLIEYEESDVEVIVDGDDSEDELKTWAILDSDME